MAEVTPPPRPKQAGSWLGRMEGRIEIVGGLDLPGSDIIDSDETLREWDEITKQANERLKERRKR